MKTVEPKASKDSRRPWEPPTVKTVGTVAEVLKGGGGKLSVVANDTGDVNKPKGQG
jgi:hypothetical protein